MKENKRWCLYMHTCPNGKKYIGITNNIKRRWGAMGQEYHSCKNFYYAIRQFGWMNITHEVIISGLTKEEAGIKEQEYIKKYKSTNPRYGYNMTNGGFGVPNNSGYRRVEQYDLTGKYITTYNTIKDAAKSVGVNGAEISHICRKDKGHVTAHGYIFRYEGDDLDLHLLIRSDCKGVLQLDEKRNIINRFLGITYAAKYIKCDPSSISKVLVTSGKINGYYWCKAENYDSFQPNINRTTYPKKIKQFDKYGNLISTYSSIAEASRLTNVNRGGIISCLKNRYKQSGGFIWEYADETENDISEEVS